MRREENVTFLVGPTAAGKTAVSIELARQLGGEIVSADSMQVYRGLDILSAKPSAAERNLVRHHLIDILEPEESFDVSRYCQLARRAITGIYARGRIPIVVGGSGMYMRALIDGLFEGPGRDEEVRRRLEKEGDEKGIVSLYEKLKVVDPDAAGRIHPNDKKRIIRALEVFEKLGKKLSDMQKEWGRGSDGIAEKGFCYSTNLNRPILVLGLMRDRDELKRRIDERVESMFERGAVEEVERLLKMGLDPKCTIWQSLGLKEVRGYLEGNCTLQESKELLKRKTRAFAKRQLTWFKKDDRIKWVYAQPEEDANRTAGEIVKFLQHDSS